MSSKKLAAALKGIAAIDPRDVLLVGGIACISTGLWRVDPAIALTVVGAFLVYLALWHQRAGGTVKTRVRGRES